MQSAKWPLRLCRFKSCLLYLSFIKLIDFSKKGNNKGMKKIKFVEIGAPGVFITGEVKSDKSISVKADVKGAVECDATVEINCGASIDGDVIAKSIQIVDGEVEGDVRADDVLICNAGVVKGNIFCKTLAIDEGGMLLGRCSMDVSDKDESEE